MYALTFPKLKLIFIIDCGLKLGLPSNGKDNVFLPLNLENFVKSIDLTYQVYVLFSHGHLDHIGMAAKLYRLLKEKNLNAVFLATEPTVKLTEVMGKDAIRIREKNNLPPHFGLEDLSQLINAIRIVRSSDWINLGNDCLIRFKPAGHIRGAASIFIKLPYGIFLYSGDISFYDTTTVRGAEKKVSEPIRWLVIDSTNGNRLLPDPETEFQRMISHIKRIIRNQGHVLVPNYSTGRGQDMGIALGRAFGPEECRIFKARLFMGGLMRSTAEACHYSHWESDIPFAGEGRNREFHLAKENIRWITNDIRELVCATGKIPGIFNVPHGMLMGGISRKLLELIASNPKNAIIFSGFQAEGTDGGRFIKLKRGDRFSLRLANGEVRKFPIVAEVEKYGFAGHGGGDQSANWVQNMNTYDPRGLDLVIMVHGDRCGQSGLKQRLSVLPNQPKRILVGENNQSIPLYA